MSRKKKKQEEILKTHVLNIKEIREAEKEDKRERRKKIPGVFFGIGIILITLGVCISILLANVFRNEKPGKTAKKDKNTLKCVSNLKQDLYKIEIHTETVYKFNSGKLASSNLTSKIAPSTTENNLTNLINNLHSTGYLEDIINDANNGINYKLVLANTNKLNIEYSINYNKIVDNTKIKVYEEFLSQPIVNKNYTYEQIKKDSEKLGSLCN